jgi:hypothetical protein
MNAYGHQEPTGRSCPHCQRRTDRVARRWHDRVLSLFVPVERYRCVSAGCGWEGLLKRRHRPQWLEPARMCPKNPPPPT